MFSSGWEELTHRAKTIRKIARIIPTNDLGVYVRYIVGRVRSNCRQQSWRNTEVYREVDDYLAFSLTKLPLFFTK